MAELTNRPKEEVLPSWGVGILESHHAPDFEMEWRRHDFLKMVYALSGEGTIHINNASFRFSSPCVVCVPAGAMNRLVDAPHRQVSIYVLCLSRNLLAFDASIERGMRAGVYPCEETIASRAEHLLRGLLFHQKHPSAGTPLEMVSRALRFLQTFQDVSALVARPKNSVPEVGDEMSSYVRSLDTRFYEADDIESAATQLGMSRRAFTSRFREATGASWHEYVRARAIRYSQELLRETDAPIVAIAFECGFNDLSTFYRQFKRRVGESPAAWREKNNR